MQVTQLVSQDVSQEMYSSVVLDIWSQQILAAGYHILCSAQMQPQSKFAFQTDTFRHAV